MIYKVIPLREEENGFTPTLTTYLLDPVPEGANYPLVIICPGGAYSFCSPTEAEPVAMQFTAAGVHACVLNYSVAPFRYPRPQEELSMAIALVREHAEEWRVDPNKIAVCGFSAGGHLACSAGVLWNSDPNLKRDDQMNKPNAMILSYPVVMYNEFANQASFENLCGTDDELKKYLSLEKHVSKDTPPAFIWHTFEDTCVPVENSMMLASELKKNNIPFELHIYQKGCHGLSLATKEVGFDNSVISSNLLGWPQLAVSWLKELD